jgi:hypothetical protein
MDGRNRAAAHEAVASNRTTEKETDLDEFVE